MVDQAEAQKVDAVLKRVKEIAEKEGMGRTAETIDTAIKTLGYEAAGFRIPRCSQCFMADPDPDRVSRINRDRFG